MALRPGRTHQQGLRVLAGSRHFLKRESSTCLTRRTEPQAADLAVQSTAQITVVLGTRYELGPESAVAAVEDWLDTMTSRGYWENRPDFADAMRGNGQTLHFHATDAPGARPCSRGAGRRTQRRARTGAQPPASGPPASSPARPHTATRRRVRTARPPAQSGSRRSPPGSGTLSRTLPRDRHQAADSPALPSSDEGRLSVRRIPRSATQFEKHFDGRAHIWPTHHLAFAGV